MALNIPTEGTKLNELKINIVDTQETFEAMKIANKVNENELYFIEKETSYKTSSIPMGHVDSTSTSTNFTATIKGITELRDGVCVWLGNGVVTSEEGFTININNLGAKPCYNSLAAATRSSTIFNKNYTMLLIYNSTRVTGGCWDIVYGYDSNTDTQVRVYKDTTNADRPILSSRTASSSITSGSTAVYATIPSANMPTINPSSGLMKVPGGITGNLNGKATTAGTADVANSVTWDNVSAKPTTFTPAAHTHSEIVTVGDKRNDATTPNSYSNKIIFQGLKAKATIGNPTTDTYSYVIGLRGWSDSSGGNSHELAFNNTGLQIRNGATTTWNSWRHIATADLAGVGGTTTPIYVAADGKLTALNYTIAKSVPSDAVFTDIKVTQNNTTAANDYRILLSYNANDTTETNTVNKNTNLRYNPSTNTLSTGNISSAGNLTITGNTNLNGETYAENITAGSLLVNGNTNFVQIPTAPTPATTSNDTSIATTAFVKNNLGGLSGAMHFKGTTTTALNDGTTTAAVTISGNSYTPSAGDVVLYSDSEFVWTGSAWERLGRDSSFKVTQTAVTDTAYSGTDTSTTFVTAVTQNANGEITVTKRKLPTYNNYSHPTTTAVNAAAVKVGKDNLGHVVLGNALTASDVGAATSGHTHTTALATDTGTATVTLAHNTTYKLTTGGTSVIFKTPTDNNTWNALSTSQAGYVAQAPNDTTKFLRGDASWATLPVATSSVAGIMKLGANGGAATYGHTHTTSLATDTGTSTITLESAGKYKLTAGGTSVIFTMPTSNNYSHPTTTAASAAAVKVGKDSLGHVVLGNALTASDVSAFEKQAYNVGTLEAGIRPLVNQSRANRLVFLPANQIIIEKTTDGGRTWTDAGYTDAQKEALFTENNGAINIPLLNNAKSTQCGLRVTITGMKYTVPSGTAETAKYSYWKTANVTSTERYFNVREWWFWVSANNDTIRPQIYCATPASPNNWVTVFDSDFGMTGWSGSDWIRAGDGKTFGGGTTQTGNYWNWRLVFWSRIPDGKTAFQSATIQSIQQIRCYGDSVWTSSSNNLMAKDHLYSWDNSKNAAFPANITATQFTGIINGSLATSSVDIANGDKLVIIDSSNSNKITPSNTSFDGSTESSVLSKKGTWVALPTATSLNLSNYILKSTLSGAYDIMYSSAANTPTRLAANTTTTKKFLRMTGTGSAGAAPAWDTVTKSDVGLGNVENTALSTWTGSTAITTLGTISTGTVPWARLSNVPTTFTPASHTHGNLTNDGKISTTATINSGDKLVIVDSDSTAASKITGSSITFGTSTTTFLSNKGTWVTPPGTYSLPLAASGTRGGIQIGYSESGNNYAVKLSSEKAYVTVPWTDTKNTAGSTDTSSKIYLIGATSQAVNPQTYSDDQIYATNGQLDANKVRVAEAVSLIYDTTLQALNFVFA